MTSLPKISQQDLMDRYSYDADTGVFTRLTSSRGWKAGQAAGYVCHVGYRRILVGRRQYLAHRLAWLYVYGYMPDYVDHINGQRDDNRICNLRPATQSQNIANSKRATDNRSGFKGASWNSKNQRWVGFIRINGVNKYLGQFDTAQEAHDAYMKAAIAAFGEFARAA